MEGIKGVFISKTRVKLLIMANIKSSGNLFSDMGFEKPEAENLKFVQN